MAVVKGKRVVLVGGGHAHMTVLKEARAFKDAGLRLILISPDEFHYYSGMGPGLLGGNYTPDDIRFNVRKMVERGGGEFIRGRVVRVSPERKILYLDKGGIIEYDIVSFNVGSQVAGEITVRDGADVFPVKPVYNLCLARNRILEWERKVPLRVVVVGGGPAGVEVAGCVQALLHEKGVNGEVSLVAGSGLLKELPDRARKIIRVNFRRRGINIYEGMRCREIGAGIVRLSEGREIPADMVFLATGTIPPPFFRESGLPAGPDGGLLVNEYLQTVGFPDIFGGGDCIHFSPLPLKKVGVHAVRQNPVLFHNLLAWAEGRALKKFIPGGGYLLVLNLGGGKGVFWRNALVFNGRPAFFIKDYIDRRFMKRFQTTD